MLGGGTYRRLALLGGTIAWAVGSSAHGPAEYPKYDDVNVWLLWTFPPLVTVNLLVAILIYSTGIRRIWQRAGVGNVVSTRQVWSFASGMFVLVLALLSPIDAMSDDLGWMHMIQHMLIINVAAPLVVMGAPGLAFLWVLPMRLRKWFGSFERRSGTGRMVHYMLWQPVALWLLFALTLWTWHLPGLYERALHNELFHDFQHLTFLLTACLFWRVLLDPVARLRLSRVGAVLYLFLTSLHATVLGVFMALAQGVWYPTYEVRTLSWNFTPLQDQQLAGLIMWMPACMVYAVIAAVVLAYWLQTGRNTNELFSRERA
jgi:putative membrane protein